MNWSSVGIEGEHSFPLAARIGSLIAGAHRGSRALLNGFMQRSEEMLGEQRILLSTLV